MTATNGVGTCSSSYNERQLTSLAFDEITVYICPVNVTLTQCPHALVVLPEMTRFQRCINRGDRGKYAPRRDEKLRSGRSNRGTEEVIIHRKWLYCLPQFRNTWIIIHVKGVNIQFSYREQNTLSIIKTLKKTLNIKTLQFTFCLRSILQRHLANAITTPSTFFHVSVRRSDTPRLTSGADPYRRRSTLNMPSGLPSWHVISSFNTTFTANKVLLRVNWKTRSATLWMTLSSIKFMVTKASV